MANCSIPNSSPVSGRISTKSSRRSRRRNSAATSFLIARSRAKPSRSWASSFFNAQRPTPNAQRSIQTIRRWMLDVGRWTFSFSGRVKGAWWPSRSSKPSSPCKRRGRFDSYPLRTKKISQESRKAGKRTRRGTLGSDNERDLLDYLVDWSGLLSTSSLSCVPAFLSDSDFVWKGGDRQCRVSGSIS